MVAEVVSRATLPASAEKVFARAVDLSKADWLPSVSGIQHVGGAASGVGAQYSVLVHFMGHDSESLLTCTKFDPPRQAVFSVDEGMKLTLQLEVIPVEGGSELALTLSYRVGGGPFGAMAEKASEPAARHEVSRAVEAFAANFRRR